MELTPSQVSNASFTVVRKGYDREEVDAFLIRAARALEEAQQQATAMEARARAAVARLQEATAASEQAPPIAAPAPEPVVAAPLPPSGGLQVDADDAEMITRTLLLAQRTADATIADARAAADRLLNEARADSEATIDSTRELSAKLVEDARSEARKASEAERTAAENEVQSLVARREFLTGDVDQLEQFLEEQRERLRAAARQIEALCDRVPAGLGHVHAPVLSASDDSPGDITAEHFRPPLASLPPDDLDLDPTMPMPAVHVGDETDDVIGDETPHDGQASDETVQAGSES